MKIVVCLHAPGAAAEGESAVGTDDAYALALAFALGPTHSVIAMLAGPASDEGPLRRALALGAARAVRLTGEDFGSADFHTLGQSLAAGIKRVGAELVLAGARSDDDGLGAVPASIARHVAGAVHVACIESLAVAGEGAVEISVRGGGRRRRLRLPLPAVLSVIASGPDAPVMSVVEKAPPAIEVLSLVDPEATVVRRRTELLGQPELPWRVREEVTSAATFVAGLTRT